jgi:hypothetical protein
VLFLWKEGGFLYPVSDAFLQAVQENTRKYYWTGRITTKGKSVYEFGPEDIVRGSGSITSQCCGSTEMEIGTVYAAELDITLFLDVGRYSMEGALVEMFYHLRLPDGSYEEIPMGLFEVSEANRRMKTLEVKAYDLMVRFEDDFSDFESVGDCYDLMSLCAAACDVELAQSRDEIEAMQNGDLNLAIYEDNDIETYRDVLYYVAQILGGFFFIDRKGKLELKRFSAEPVFTVGQKLRYSSTVSDFVTRYTAVSSTNSLTETAEYYHLDPDNGLTMNLGENPLLQYGLDVSRESICKNILQAIQGIAYVPFSVETIGNPALDIGDVVKLTGGQMAADGELGCITSRILKIGGREKLTGVGKDPALSRAKSKNDKNLTGILNKVDANSIQMVLFTNAKELSLGTGKRVQAEQITFAVRNQTTVEFQGQIVVRAQADEEDSLSVCEAVFVFDREEITVHHPVETWVDGKHILSLYYPLEEVVADQVHDLRVYLTMSCGSGTVEIGDAIGCVRGFGLASAGVEWDGTITIEETMDGVSFSDAMEIAGIRETIVFSNDRPQVVGTTEGISFVAMPIGTMADFE